VLDSALALLPTAEPVDIEAPAAVNGPPEATPASSVTAEAQPQRNLSAEPAAAASPRTIFTVEMLPAALGDSLWLEWGDAAKPRRMLIDGGLSGTADTIRAKIDAVAATEGTCRLELLVVTHIDGDHIEGIIKLLGQPDLPIDVGDVWFNGRKHMPDPEGEDEEAFLGARHGEFLSAIIEERELPWNQWRDGKTIYVPPESRGKLPTLELPGGLRLTLLSPGYPELVKLSKTWEKELVKAGLDRASHEEILAALIADRKLAPTDDDFLSDRHTGPPDVAELMKDQKRKDGSHANGASIAFLAEFDDRSCLLTGDAHWPVLVRALDRLMKERSVERLPLTALKVPHHGSRNNIYDDLLAQLDCHRYLVSTNGSRFKHPDGAALARAVGGPQRGTPLSDDDPVDLIFNYRTEQNEVWDDDDLRDTWNYNTQYPVDGTEGFVFDVIAG
jgi:beta-lactamase superfamily II metal-dependent hydrolase